MRRTVFFLKLTLLIGLCNAQLVFGQHNEIDSLKHALKGSGNDLSASKINLQLAKLYERVDLKLAIDHANKVIEYKVSDSLMAEGYNQLGRSYFFMRQLDSAAVNFTKAKGKLLEINDVKKAAIIDIGIGAIQLRQGDYNGTIKTLTQCASFFEAEADMLNAAKCYNNMATAMAELENYDKAIEFSEKALSIFDDKELIQYKLITLPNLAAQYLKTGDTIKAIQYNHDAEKLAEKENDKRSLSIIYNNLGSIYLDRDSELARNYLEETIALKNELNLKSGVEVALGNLGHIYLQNKDYDSAIKNYSEVLLLVKGKQRVFAFDQIADAYRGKGDYKAALAYAILARTLNDSILDTENRKVFNEIQTKYETEKAFREYSDLKVNNLEIDSKRRRNQNLLIIASILLLMSLAFGYLMHASVLRKKELAQQSFKIKQQELEKLLKTRELEGIDAIIDAQEQERSRMADDLHDNLGSKIATLKLYIEEIRNRMITDSYEREMLLGKLKYLADEAYKEVRTIAHNKNTKSYISKGLIIATQTVADQISMSNQLTINVFNVDVNQFISNAIEIQVFRSIQELLTNVIKHAHASVVNIQFSKDDGLLLVIVEDNGRGFELNTSPKAYGLKNIDDRMDKLSGSMNIDSTPGNGTTVILTVPI
ncbi:tetratricopeptide repeat protein [Carboxylicivirga sp. N1Y90]|uniref:tetratricopeptide repeat-containing sensor histidine kinase n=1 Tax=Carboxylicivirga fragile TaxID=3417571 RepID=UPI003D32CE86|nr:tetratricopeptide repeat protein [Marinilabiliaceae bacterium N1Y90]